MLAKHFQRFRQPGRLHFAAHSHHLWPDVTEEAHARAWSDAASGVDLKWDTVFEELLPETRGHIARLLALPDPDTVTFAPNTHEFVVRIASCLPAPFTVVTTDAEFHSFRRQMARWEEAGTATVTRVTAEPFDTFPTRFKETVEAAEPDLVYLSHVFYNSGYVIPDLAGIVGLVERPGTFVVIDGYHSFMALPVDLSPIADRAFFLAGGYKYAMAGEGACFLHCPPGYGQRPTSTGWMAEFGALSGPAGAVGYTDDGNRFFGSTFDPTPFYRFNAVQRLLARERVTVEDIHQHARSLQQRFVSGLDSDVIDPASLLPSWETESDRGNFLTFRTSVAESVHRSLLGKEVITDYRHDRLRFGFGVYQTAEDVDRLLAVVNGLGLGNGP